MRINNNISGIIAFNSLNSNTNKLEKSLKSLSTGLRINSSADDAAGFAISNGLRSQTVGLRRALQNAQDGISLLQTADGALDQTNSMLMRMRELAVQAANDTLTSQDRNYIQMEIDGLREQIDLVSQSTTFNKKNILDGSCCGTCVSDDLETKAYVRGSINVEGNYRIDIRPKPGVAQVQKSSILKIKHEDVVTNAQLNSNNGIGKISINDVPAGDYNITTTKPGGGQVEITYDSVLTGTVTEANTSGLPETMTLEFTDSDGNTVQYAIPLSEDDNTESKVASVITKQLDGRTITIGEQSYELKAEDNGNGTYKISYTTEQEFPTITEINSSVTAFKYEPTTKPSTKSESQNTYLKLLGSHTYDIGGTNTSKATQTQTKASATVNGKGITFPYSINFTFTDQNSNATGNIPITISDPGGSMSDDQKAAYVASKISEGLNGKKVKLSDNSEEEISCSVSDRAFTVQMPGKFKIETDAPFSLNESNSTTYVYNFSGSDTVTKGNTTDAKETIKFTFYYGTYSNYYASYALDSYSSSAIEVPIASGMSENQVAKQIADTINGKQITIRGQQIKLKAEANGANYTITTPESFNSSGRFQIAATVTTSATTSASGKTQATLNAGYPKENQVTKSSGAVVNLTGFYGDEEAQKSLSMSVDSKSENNASMLFEVKNKSVDELTGRSTITLSAISNVLKTDGSTASYEKEFIFSSLGNTVDIGALLGKNEAGNFNEDYLKLTLDPAKFDLGDKFVYNVSGNGSTNKPADVALYVTGSLDDTWAYSWGENEVNNVSYNDAEIQYNLNSNAVSTRLVHFRNFYLNSDNGRVHNGEISIEFTSDFGEAAQKFPDPPTPEDIESGKARENELTLASFSANYVGKIATGNTKLRDIEQFWTKSGVFMLETPQVINITQGDGKRTSVTLNASDTLNDVRLKLNTAISEGLDQGRYITGGNANNIVTFVENPTIGSGAETVKGTFLIRSLIPGSAGRLSFSSSYGELIDSLALNTIYEPSETSYLASVYDAHDGSVIASNVETSENILKGIIDKNIDIEFNPMATMDANWSKSDKNFILNSKDPIYSTVVHVVKNRTTLQIGTFEGEDFPIEIADMSSDGLGINSVNVMNHDTASRSITVLDNAIRRVSVQRSKIGAQQNYLESRINDLTVTNTNLTTAESRIRDTDMAENMMEFVRLQILNQSGTSMLAQANQMPNSVLSLF